MNSDSAVQATEEQNLTSSYSKKRKKNGVIRASLLEFLGKHKWNGSFARQMFVSIVGSDFARSLVSSGNW